MKSIKLIFSMLLIIPISNTTSAIGLENTHIAKIFFIEEPKKEQVLEDVIRIVHLELQAEPVSIKPVVTCMVGESYIDGNTYWFACVKVERGHYMVNLTYNSTTNQLISSTAHFSNIGCDCEGVF